MQKFNPTILDLIVCPRTGQKLYYDKEDKLLVTKDKKYSYKIRNGTPILLVKNESNL
tara:strand:+ start:339 stop:509 length:171 start_codon:yes stop_codon:yes gene_type:complete